MLSEWQQKISVLLKDRGMERKEVADQLGVSVRTLYDIEKGRKPTEPVAKLIDALISGVLGRAPVDRAISQNIVTMSPGDLYRCFEELWIVSDRPAAIIDLEALMDVLCDPDGKRAPLVTFFMPTLEGAEQFASLLARQLVDFTDKLDVIQRRRYTGYVYLVVTNTIPYHLDAVIADPGSNCCGKSSGFEHEVYVMSQRRYVKVDTSAKAFIDTVKMFGIGGSQDKKNFFPLAMPLRPNILHFKHGFLDPTLYGIRGDKPGVRAAKQANEEEISDLSVGGILRRLEGREQQTIEFNNNCRFAPVFILTYKRTPEFCDVGDTPLKLLQQSLKQIAQESDFWGAPPGQVNKSLQTGTKNVKA